MTSSIAGFCSLCCVFVPYGCRDCHHRGFDVVDRVYAGGIRPTRIKQAHQPARGAYLGLAAPHNCADNLLLRGAVVVTNCRC